jgi:citrate synthase
MYLKDKIASQLPEWQERVRKLVKEHGDVKVGDVTVAQVYGGMRSVKSLVTDISSVDPNEGIRLRGYTIPELLKALPKPTGGEIPMAGGLYYLLLTGEIPTQAQAQEIEDEWKARSAVPEHVFQVLDAMPAGSHAMTLFSMAILSLQGQSVFTRQYDEGMRREDYWEPTLEDSLNLTAKLPTIAAYIHHMRTQKRLVAPDPNLDWSANFAHMMGINKPDFRELARLYFLIHSDHESGNVSAHATHLVGSALSDVYYATSAAMDGLAGPLHGRANQESLRWLEEVYGKYQGVPSKEALEKFAWETLNSGQVIPGYGHAVLRKTDPRYSALHEFGKQHMADDDLFRLADLLYDVVPDVLREQGKAKNPWPNVDAISGTLLHHYDVHDCVGGTCGFYTVMFGVSRILGVSANMVWARALGQPLERPKSLTTSQLEEIVANAS